MFERDPRFVDSAESVQETDVRGTAAGRTDAARRRVAGVQGGRRAHAEAAVVQGRQGDQSGRHIRADGRRRRRVPGRVRLRGHQRHGLGGVHVQDTGGPGRATRRRPLERGQVTRVLGRGGGTMRPVAGAACLGCLGLESADVGR